MVGANQDPRAYGIVPVHKGGATDVLSKKAQGEKHAGSTLYAHQRAANWLYEHPFRMIGMLEKNKCFSFSQRLTSYWYDRPCCRPSPASAFTCVPFALQQKTEFAFLRTRRCVSPASKLLGQRCVTSPDHKDCVSQRTRAGRPVLPRRRQSVTPYMHEWRKPSLVCTAAGLLKYCHASSRETFDFWNCNRQGMDTLLNYVLGLLLLTCNMHGSASG